MWGQAGKGIYWNMPSLFCCGLISLHPPFPISLHRQACTCYTQGRKTKKGEEGAVIASPGGGGGGLEPNKRTVKSVGLFQFIPFTKQLASGKGSFIFFVRITHNVRFFQPVSFRFVSQK